MNEKFIKAIYEEIISEGKNSYKDLFENTKIENNNIEYFSKSIKFYNSINNIQKDILFTIIEQTMIDTIAQFLNILDNSLPDYNINISINGVNTEDELADTFLEFIEEKEEK